MFNLEKIIKKYLKKRIRITTALIVTFLIIGNLGYAAEDEIYDEKKMFSIMAEIAVNNINYENEEEMILAAKKLYKKRYRISSYVLVENQNYKTKSTSKKLDTWHKGTDNYKHFESTDKIKKYEKEEIKIDKIIVSEKDNIVVDGGNITINNSYETITKDNSSNIASTGKTGTVGSNWAGTGGNGGKGANNSLETTGNTIIDNKNYIIIGSTGGNGGTGGLGGKDYGSDKYYIPGVGGNGGIGGDAGSSVGINYTNSSKKMSVNNNYTVIGGTGGTGGDGGRGGWADSMDHWGIGGSGGAGGKGGNAVGISISGKNNNLELKGNIIVTGGKGGTGGNAGGTIDPAGDGSQNHITNNGGNGGDGGNAIGISSSDNILNNTGTIIAIGGTGGLGGKSTWKGKNGNVGNYGTGIGIQGNNNTILNTGVLAGSTSAISGNNNKVTNIGIMGTTSGNNIVSGSGNNFINAGITAEIDTTRKITNIISSSSGIDVTIDGIIYTSMQMKNEIGDQSNKIINATNSTKVLIIGQDTNLTDVIINGADYNNASININAGKTIIESGIINSLNTNAIKVNNSGELIFSSSTAEGSIDLSNGNNKLTFSNGSSLTGNIITGVGDNDLIFDRSKYEIALDLSKGNDNLTIKNGSILGEVILGSGNNIVKIDNAEYNGILDMTSGNDELYLLNGGVYGGNVTFGTGDNKLYINNAEYQKDINFKEGNNVLEIEKGNLYGDIFAGNGADKFEINNGAIFGNIDLGSGDNITKLNNSYIVGNIVTGNGEDKLHFKNSKITGNIDVGDGNDEVELLNTVLGGNLTLGNGNNILKVQDNSFLYKNIYLGNGENTVLVDRTSHLFGSVVGGNSDDTIIFESGGEELKYIDMDITLGSLDKGISTEENTIKTGDNTYLAGKIIGSNGTDKIYLGETEESQNIFASALNNINELYLKGKTKLLAAAKMYAENIEIHGDLYLEMDMEQKKDGIYVGHGLYGGNGVINVENEESNMIIDTSRFDKNSIIDLGNINLNFTNEQLKSDSLIHSVVQGNNGNLQVIVDHSLPLQNGNGLPAGGLDGGFIRYQELNQVYQSIYTAGKIGYLAQDVKLSDKSKEEAFRSLLSFLNQIYANNVYGYATKLSVDSLDLYKQAIITNTQSVGTDEWLIQGVSLYSHKEKKNDTIGRNFYGWDRGKEKFDISTNTAGLLGMAEVGLTDKNTFGFDFAGSYQNSQISNSSELKAKSFYLGLHNRYEDGNLKFISGTGIQFNKYQGIRVVRTNYSYSKNKSNFDTIGFQAFVDLKYKHEMKEGIYLIPHYSLNIGAISMSDIKEEHTKDSLGIEVDGRGTMFINNELGVKLQKEGKRQDLAYKLYAGAFYVNREGNNSYDLTGRIREGGSNFKILGERLENNNVKIEAGIEIEVDTGLSFNLGVTQEFDSKERRTQQYKASLGYKF